MEKKTLSAGSEDEFGPGEVSLLPPGHDAWVVGEEPVVVIDISGMASYAKAGLICASSSTGRGADSGSVDPTAPRRGAPRIGLRFRLSARSNQDSP